MASDDSILRVFNLWRRTHSRSYRYVVLYATQTHNFISVVDLIDLKVHYVKRFSLFSEYPFVEATQTKFFKDRRGLEVENWDFLL